MPDDSMKRLVCVLVVLIAASLPGEEWTPPEHPDLQQILGEAHQDCDAGRYELALAKHVWFHEHALEIEPAMSGVRLSFALGYWHQLGQKYPPALEMLKSTRDQAGQAVTAPGDTLSAFQEFAAINRELKDDARTKALFVKLDAEQPSAAAKVFHMARPALVRAKDYELCAKYIHPQKDVERLKKFYKAIRRLKERNPNRPGLDAVGEKRLVNDATTSVAILAVTGRKKEALAMARQAREIWDDTDFATRLSEALNGVVPEPWP
ncbi:MAG: hypothetical protein ACK5Q5_14705 [Planctomycetaceae bacterium]